MSIPLAGQMRKTGGSGAFGHAQDLLECLHVPHRVVDGIVVMGRLPESLPALRVAPVSVEAGPEVADAAARVPERVIHPGAIEHAGKPQVGDLGQQQAGRAVDRTAAPEQRDRDLHAGRVPPGRPAGDLR